MTTGLLGNWMAVDARLHAKFHEAKAHFECLFWNSRKLLECVSVKHTLPSPCLWSKYVTSLQFSVFWCFLGFVLLKFGSLHVPWIKRFLWRNTFPHVNVMLGNDNTSLHLVTRSSAWIRTCGGTPLGGATKICDQQKSLSSRSKLGEVSLC